jgi:ATP-dependent Clp protease adaptor protein ClpS
VSTKKPKRKPGSDTGIEILERVSTKKPRKFQVLMHNDDYTTQEFVVHILQVYFRKDPTEASHIMIKVHTTGQAIVGCYTRDVAETKVELVTGYARDNGMPLMITSEPEP